jgi:uncharacterized protein (TIGR03083 family)
MSAEQGRAATLEGTHAEGRQIIELAQMHPGAQVPQYPGWTLRDLVAHLGQVHGRTIEICRTLPAERIPGPEVPTDRDLYAWAGEILEQMVDALAAADPDAEVWTMIPGARLAFWERRMLVETGVHRWDAESAQGDPEPLRPLVAVSGLDEFEALYLPRLGDVPTIELQDPAMERRWRYGAGEPEATLAGPASDHFLRLMSRPGTALPHAWEAAVDALAAPAAPG